MWKFHDFSNTQILREINFRDFTNAKYPISTHFEVLNFDSFEFLHFLKAEIYQIHKIKAPKMTNTTVFRTYKFSKIDFT